MYHDPLTLNCFAAQLPIWLVVLTICSSAANADVEFFRDVYPIFEQHCLRCHGPGHSDAGLRLDRVSEARKKHDSGVPILGGVAENEILKRIATDNIDIRMPKGSPPLSAKEIEVIRQWIEMGVPWPERDPSGKVERSQAYSPHFAWRLEDLTDWNVASWSNAKTTQFIRWRNRLVIPLLMSMLFAALCERCREWGRQALKQDVPRPLPRWQTRLAGVPRTLHLCFLLIIALWFLISFSQEVAMFAENTVRGKQEELDRLRGVEVQPTMEENPHPVPVRMKHPRRLGGEYYRGNDERGPELFNGGFYRTATMRLRLCTTDGTTLHWGDPLVDRQLVVELEIEPSPATLEHHYSDEIWKQTFLSELGFREEVTNPGRQIATFIAVDSMKRLARYPVEVPSVGEEARRGTIYVYLGAIAENIITASAHYGIVYSLRIADGRIADDSELWMGYILKTGGVATLPSGQFSDDEWFSFRPIPEIDGPRLLRNLGQPAEVQGTDSPLDQ